MSTIELTIEGMHCGACVRRVKAALGAVPGLSVREVEIGRAAIDVADGTSPSTARAEAARAVVDAGFVVAQG